MSIIERAAEIVNRYVSQKAGDAVARVEIEAHGKGCGCRNCVVNAVEEANSWIEFIAGEEPDIAEGYKFRVVKRNGRLFIYDPRRK